MSDDDEAGKPIWGVKPPERNVLSSEQIAQDAGVSPAAMQWALDQMVQMGTVRPVLSPLCRQCGGQVGEFNDPDEIPDEVTCPECGQTSHVSDLDLRLGYAVVSPGS